MISNINTTNTGTSNIAERPNGHLENSPTNTKGILKHASAEAGTAVVTRLLNRFLNCLGRKSPNKETCGEVKAGSPRVRICEQVEICEISCTTPSAREFQHIVAEPSKASRLRRLLSCFGYGFQRYFQDRAEQARRTQFHSSRR